MLDSGDNEFVYMGCKKAIENGIAKFTIKELEKGFSKEELGKYKDKNP